MSKTIKLPENTTEWRQACERAANFANDGNGNIQGASEYLKQHGWEHFGLESISLPEAGQTLDYLNTGETYCPTVCTLGDRDRCFVSSWGDWLEQAEQKYCQENDVIRCSNCGQFTPLVDGSEWHEIKCEHCEKHVDGHED